MKFFSPQTPAGKVCQWIWILAASFVMGAPAQAQISPEGRDRTYKQANPERFEERFDVPPVPQSTVVPVQPDTLEPIFPENLKQVRFKLKELKVRGSTVYADTQFLPMYRNFLLREVTLEHIYRIAGAITKKYRNDGYILSRAVVPPQTIENGVALIDIVEGYVDTVKVQGPVEGPKALLNAYRKALLKSRPLQARDLERYLLLMDDLPGLAVQSVLTPSESNSGASRLTLVLTHKPYDAHLGVDNRGTRFNGPIQLFAGASENTLLGWYERLGVHGVMTGDPSELAYVRAYFDLPVSGEGTVFSASGAFSRSEPGSSLAVFDVEGESHTFAVGLSHPFLRSRGETLRGACRLHPPQYRDRHSRRPRLRGSPAGARFRPRLRLRRPFFLGVNLVRFAVHQGLNILDATGPGSLNLTRAQGKSDFTKLTGELTRLQQLVPTWMLLGSFAWQYSFEKLLASEEFGVGGGAFGRAYDPSEITGDSGVAFKVELQKAFALQKKYLRDVQAYTFFDFGSVWNRVATATGARRQEVASTGVGARFHLTEVFSGYLEVDFPLNRDVSAESDRDPRVFFSFSARF